MKEGTPCVSCVWAEKCQGREDLDQLLRKLSFHSYIRDVKVSFQCTEYVEKSDSTRALNR